MKKIIAVLCAAALLAFAGCSAKQEETKSEVTTTPVTTTKAVSTPDQARASADSAEDKKVLTCIANEYVTLRDAPTTEGKELAKVKKGEEVTYLSNEGAFFRVIYQGTTGYVMRGYFADKANGVFGKAPDETTVSTDPTASNVAPTVPGTPVNLTNGDTLYCIAQDGVILRERASRTAEQVGDIDCLEPVIYLETSGDWYKVDYDGVVGYVMGRYFSPQEDAAIITD